MSGRFWSRPEVRLFIFFVVASGLIGQAERARSTRGAVEAAASTAAGLVRPGQRALQEGGHLLAGVGSIFGGDRSQKEANDALATEVMRLRAQTARLEGLQAENIRLRKLLRFAEETKLDVVAADVLGGSASPWFKTVTIDLGESDGIRPGMAVAGYDGLIGQVFRTQSATADVCLLTDPDSSVSVVDTRSGALGIARGTNTSALQLTYLRPDADVQRGDELMTSGVGGVFPRGLKVGTVTKLSYDAHLAQAAAQVKPAARLLNPREVLVYLGGGEG
jgi:rod shape-determining protein MreC